MAAILESKFGTFVQLVHFNLNMGLSYLTKCYQHTISTLKTLGMRGLYCLKIIRLNYVTQGEWKYNNHMLRRFDGDTMSRFSLSCVFNVKRLYVTLNQVHIDVMGMASVDTHL